MIFLTSKSSEIKMDVTTEKSDEIPTWAYAVAGGAVAGLTVLGTTFFVWRHKRGKIQRARKINQEITKMELEAAADSIRASTPRSQ
jgi:hypothetical protein